MRTARSARGSDTTTGGSDRRPVAEPGTAGPGRPEPVSADDLIADPASQPPRPQPLADTPGGIPAVVPAVPPAPAPVLLSPGRIWAPQVVGVPRLTAPRLASDRRPGQPMTSLFGVLGLLLIPLAGAALGYRQARAARSVGALPHV
ncbi:hypothetical protein GCM10010409_38010 [Mycolicibacterium diernhoferi]